MYCASRIVSYNNYLTYCDISRMCCSTEPQSGVRMRCGMIYGIYTIHSRALQSRHDAADHTDAQLKLTQSCCLFQLNKDSLENLDVLLTSSGCLLVFYPSTLLAKPLWSLQKNTLFIIIEQWYLLQKTNLSYHSSPMLNPLFHFLATRRVSFSRIALLTMTRVHTPLPKQWRFPIIPQTLHIDLGTF